MGLPLRTRRQRSGVVIAYYAFFLICSGVGLWRSHGNIFQYLIPQVFILGGWLGGIRVGGPVKVYEDSTLPAGNGGVQTLNLAGRKEFTERLYGSPLDERERAERDRAHYEAFRILRWTVCIAAVAYWLSLNWIEAWLSTKGPILAWILVVYVLSLPQAVVLWTEPDEPRADLVEMGAPRS